MNARYAWAGGEELLHLRPGDAATSVIVALPPFEEANRLRAIMADVARRLNARGLTVAMPDLPGTGESLVATADARLADWRAAFGAAAAALPGRTYGVGIRGGALIDVEAELAGRWLWSPQGGAALARELARLQQLGDGMIAGNAVSDELLAELAGAEPAVAGSLRTVRLASEAQPADRKLDAPPPWRRAEPDGDPALAALLADDIAEWIAACDA